MRGLQIEESIIKKFADRGWNSYADFAFTVRFQPGAGPDEEKLYNGVMKKKFTDMQPDDDSPMIIKVRRLYYEAYSMAALDLQRRMSPEVEPEKPRQLPKEERAARLAALRTKLGLGFEIDEETEPSDLLVDKFVGMQERGTLKHVPWDELTKWESEARAEPKKDPHFKISTDGNQRRFLELEEAPGTERVADTGTDLKLANALTRRGVALELAQLMSFKVHETIVKWYLREYARAAVPGFAKISLAQIRDADEEIFVRMAALTRAGLGLATDGAFPLDALVPNAMKEPRVTQFMTSLQLTNPALRGNGGGQTQRHQSDGPQVDKRLASQIENLKNENKKLRAQKSNSSNFNDKGKGKGKKGKGNKSWNNEPGRDGMPFELRGLERTWKGVPLCFGYNCRSGCNNAVSNGGCKKGRHVCAKPNCGGSHPAFECNK